MKFKGKKICMVNYLKSEGGGPEILIITGYEKIPKPYKG